MPIQTASLPGTVSSSLSVFDLFVAWEHGACVCCPADGQLLEPSRYVRDARLTVWFSVPSVAMLMRRLGALKPNAFPELRLSLFCGEALPAELAAAWSEAAPSSGLENLYGPTEATVACTAQTWPPPRVSNGLVPIGKPFGETITRILSVTPRMEIGVNMGGSGRWMPWRAANHLSTPST